MADHLTDVSSSDQHIEAIYSEIDQLRQRQSGKGKGSVPE